MPADTPLNPALDKWRIRRENLMGWVRDWYDANRALEAVFYRDRGADEETDLAESLLGFSLSRTQSEALGIAQGSEEK